MATKYYSGTDGRIRTSSTATTGQAVAGVKKWALKMSGGVVDATNFESAVDSNNNVWRELVIASGGSSSSAKSTPIKASVDLEGALNSDPTTGTFANLNMGSLVYLDLFISKSEPYGIFNWGGVIVDWTLTSDLNSTDAVAFTATVELTGVAPTPTTTSA